MRAGSTNTPCALHDTVFDYSKNLITDKTIKLLLQLANECKVKEAVDAMFNGDTINETEKRSVLHTALRNFSKSPVYAHGIRRNAADKESAKANENIL